MYIHTHIYIYTYTRIYTIYVYISIYTYIQTYLPTYIHTYIQTYRHAYMHTYRHTDIHTSMHACMHAYIHKYIIYTYIISYPTVYRFESIRPLWHWQPQQVKRSKAELEAMRAEMKELKARQMPWKMWADLKCGIFWEYHRRFKGMQYKYIYIIYIYT